MSMSGPTRKKTSHQGDTINLMLQFIRELDFEVPYHDVPAHLDDVLCWDQLMDIQEVNVECNTLVKEALINGIVDHELISSRFPLKIFYQTVGGGDGITYHCNMQVVGVQYNICGISQPKIFSQVKL